MIFLWGQGKQGEQFTMKEFMMMDSPQSHLPLLLEGLSERIRDLNREFEHLYIKVELTLDL